MYIHIHQDVRCGECKTLNNYEDVTRGQFGNSETIRRCLRCKHEKVISTIRSNSFGNPVSYQLPKPDKERIF